MKITLNEGRYSVGHETVCCALFFMAWDIVYVLLCAGMGRGRSD